MLDGRALGSGLQRLVDARRMEREVLADAARVDGDAGVLADEVRVSLGPRDQVSQAIFDEVAKGKGVETPDGRPAVYLDTTRIAEEDAEISLPYMLRRYRAAGIDPLAEPILTYPVLHYQNGGLVIDTDGETTLEGLYACGEIAGGTHGRNRMMGNSLLECAVFGRRAGRAAAEKAKA